MRLLLVLLALVVAASCLDARWKLIWADEFNQASLDTTKWTARDRAGYTGELEWNAPSQVYLQNGKMVIKSETSSSHAGYSYLSGYVDTGNKFSATYGRYEVNAKLPYGRGLWPAHWMLSDTLCWPVGSEIDIMESISKPMSQVYGTYHYGTCCGCNNGNGTVVDMGVDLSQGYHTYAVEWFSDVITWYVDDRVYHKVSKSDLAQGKPFPIDASPHYLILNTAVGGDWPGSPDASTVFPQYHYIDYVRVYGWQPCVVGCYHGCCESTTGTCKCNYGWSGTNCEYSVAGDSFYTNFASKTNSDVLVDNAVISNGLKLTVTNTGCPGSCGGQPYKGGQWKPSVPFGKGDFVMVARSVKAGGTSVLFEGTTSVGGFQGFQFAINPVGNAVSFQSWGDNPYSWKSFPLSFDASAGYHTYKVSYTNVFKVYVDNVLFLTTASAPNVPLQMTITYSYSTQYFGSFSGVTPLNVYVSSASWAIATGAAAVCSTPAPTTVPTKTPTKVPTAPATPKPTPKATAKPCASWKRDFASQTANDALLSETVDQGQVILAPSNAVIGSNSLKLTISANGATYLSGGWTYNNQQFGYGTYDFTAVGPSTSGEVLILTASGGSGSYNAIRMFLTGGQRTQVSFDVFVGGQQYGIGSGSLPFDHSAGLHKYSFSFTSTAVSFYADGQFLKQTTIVPVGVSMQFRITLEAHDSWWGPLQYTAPTTLTISSVQWREC